jgi:hypothetical protein
VRRLSPLALLLLGGCAALRPHPQAAATVPPPAAVPTPCVDAAAIPAEPPMVGSKFNGDAKHDLQVLAPNAKALREWGEQMHAMLQGCAAKGTPPAGAAKP